MEFEVQVRGDTNLGVRAKKISKPQAIDILETFGNSATTWIWNYSEARWIIGETVEVVNGYSGKYLRSNPDNKLTDNLGQDS